MLRIILILPICVLFLTSCAKKEKEPNNTLETAEEISSSQTLKAGIENGSDVDYFYIAPKENSIVDISIENKDFHFLDAYLYKKNKVLIDSDPSKTDKLFRNLKADGLYLKLSSIEETSYTLKIIYKKEIDFEGEPNDNLNEASFIGDGHLLKGELKNKSTKDIDFFRIKRESDKKNLSLNLQISSTNNVDMVLKLFDLTGNLVETFDNAGLGQGESVTNYILNPPYDYILSVSNKNFLFERTIPYELLVQTIEVAEGQEYEPNDNPQTATEISEDTEEFIGHSNRDEDEDYFKIEFKKSLYSNLNVFVTPSPGVKLKVSIVDAFNNIIVSPLEEEQEAKQTLQVNPQKDSANDASAPSNTTLPLNSTRSDSVNNSANNSPAPNAQTPENISLPSSVISIQNFHITNPVYYLHIRTLGPANPEPYRVKMYHRNYERGSGIEQEPNDSVETATEFSSGQTVKSLLNSASDKDFFKFNPPEKKVYTFNFLFPNDIKPIITLYREDKKIATLEGDKTKTAFFESVDDYVHEKNKITFKMNLDKKQYVIGVSYADGSPVKNNEFYYIKVEGEKK